MFPCEIHCPSTVCFSNENTTVYREDNPIHFNSITINDLIQQVNAVCEIIKKYGVVDDWIKPKLMDYLQNVNSYHFTENNKTCLKVNYWSNNLISNIIHQFTLNECYKLSTHSYKQIILMCIKNNGNATKFHQQFAFKITHHQKNDFMITLQVYGEHTPFMHDIMQINGHIIKLTGVCGTITFSEYYMGNGTNIKYYSQLLNFKNLFSTNDDSTIPFVNIEFVFDLSNVCVM